MYKPEFYRRANIIGYTGNLYNRPTVYFRKRTATTIYYGHITQSYERNPRNIGRELLRNSPNYQIINIAGHAVEAEGTKFIHRSRTVFTEINPNSADGYRLATAITRFPGIKSMYRRRRGKHQRNG